MQTPSELPIQKEVFIQAPPQKLWQALTQKEQLKEWYFDLSGFEPRPGFEFSFWGENEGRRYLHLCTVTEAEEEKKLAYTWQYQGYEGNSLVRFELTGSDKGTKLRLVHSGLETFGNQHPDFAPSNFDMGWTYLIEKALKEYCETGTVVSAG